VQEDISPHVHLPRSVPGVDLTCPGLMLAAIASLIVGYLWMGWLSTNVPGPVLTAVRGAILPAVLVLSVYGLRHARHRLPGSSFILPGAAALVLVTVLSADVIGSHFFLLLAGGACMGFAGVAFGCVVVRERGSGDRLERLEKKLRQVIGFVRHQIVGLGSVRSNERFVTMQRRSAVPRATAGGDGSRGESASAWSH
jgi:hypothetical protein